MAYPVGQHGIAADVKGDIFGSQLTLGYSSSRFDRYIRKGIVKGLDYSLFPGAIGGGNAPGTAHHLQAAIWKAVAVLGDLAPLVTGGGVAPLSSIPLAYVRAIKFDNDQAWVEAVYQRSRIIAPDPLTDFAFDGDTETVPAYRDALRYTQGGDLVPGGPFFDASTNMPAGSIWKASEEQRNSAKFKPISRPWSVPVHRLFVRRIYNGMLTNPNLYQLIGTLNESTVALALGSATSLFSFSAGTMRFEDMDINPIYDATETRFEYIFEFVIRQGGHLMQSVRYKVPAALPPAITDGWQVEDNVATHRLADWQPIIDNI